MKDAPRPLQRPLHLALREQGAGTDHNLCCHRLTCAVTAVLLHSAPCRRPRNARTATAIPLTAAMPGCCGRPRGRALLTCHASARMGVAVDHDGPVALPAVPVVRPNPDHAEIREDGDEGKWWL